MTFTQMNYFITVAKYLSFTDAAKALFVTQPALSRQIAHMEEELKVPLFLRKGKELSLTAAGAILYEQFPKLLEEYQQVIEQAQIAEEGYDGLLRIGILDTYDVSPFLPNVLRRFQQFFPNTQVTLGRYSLRNLPLLLEEGELDLILTFGFSLYEHPLLATETIETFKSCMILSTTHPFAKKKDLSLADLKNETFAILGPEASLEGYHFLINLCDRHGFVPRTKIVPTMSDAMLWVENGGCVSFSSDHSIEQNSKNIVFVPVADTKPHETVFSFKRNDTNPVLPLFLDTFRKSEKHRH